MKIIIHAGLPKTGTSSLQIFLSQKFTTLQRYGIYYPDSQVDPGKANSGNAYWLYVMVRHPVENIRRELIRSRIFELVTLAREINCKCIVLSSEAISTFSREETRDFVDAIGHLQLETQIVLYEREPYQWCFSSWLQSIKRQGNTRWLFDSVNANSEIGLRPLLFGSRLKAVGSGLKVEFLDYSKLNKTDEIIESFIKFLPRGDEIIGDGLGQNARSNSSIGKFDTFLYLYFNRATSGDISLMDLIEREVKDQTPKFFFYDKNTDSLIYKYLNDNGENYTKIQSGVETDCSESAIFESLSSPDKSTLRKIDLFSRFSKDRIKKFRENVVAKMYFYRNSPYKKQVPSEFEIFSYLVINVDVCIQEIDPYEHYVIYGKSEGRMICAQGFSSDWD